MNNFKAFAGAFAIASLAFAQAHAQKIAEAGDVLSYTVKRGDTLIGLNERFFTRHGDYRIVQRLNRVKNPLLLPTGASLNIPTSVLRSTPIKANVAAYRGDVKIVSGSETGGPTVGKLITEGMLLETGTNGFLTLVLEQGSRVSLPSKSRVRVVRLRKYIMTGSTDLDFAIENGRTETSVTPFKDSNSHFRMRTPVAVSAVRGTTFRVGFDDGGKPSLTEVVEGHVAVNANLGGAGSILPTGFGAAVTKAGGFNQEQLLPAPAVVEPGRLQNSAQVSFTLSPTPAASGYLVQVAADAGFVDVVAANQSASPQIGFGNLPDGNYFVRALAIAPSGLQGLSETFSFKRRLTAVSASAVAGEANALRFAWLGQGDAKQVYRLQVKSEIESLLPVIDEVGLEQPDLTVVNLKPGVYHWRVGTTRYADDGVEQSWTSYEKLTVSK